MGVYTFVILFFFIICIKSEEQLNSGSISNGHCVDDIRALRQELGALREKVFLQETEILRQKGEITQLRQEVVRKPKQSVPPQSVPIQGGSQQTDQTSSIESFSQLHKWSNTKRLLMNSANISSSSTSASPKIAFYANRIKENHNLAVHQALIFSNDLTNVGNCYHHSTGTFIPNISGVYVFDVTILLCSPGHELRTDLVVEGNVMAGHYTGDSTNCSNGGGMAVLHINAGDSVWVRVQTSDGTNGIAWESSFSGFLLYAD
ncbi:complement C1q-like protein 3 [Saccostrea echinata]|uniref:complement C1q-like protein 3 n=1 Tax=Saccostrea echinata TaxID=191078 RepID=UPI002A815D0A|nr:complement C1q-like protein 3 [Saccostrea echinata]